MKREQQVFILKKNNNEVLPDSSSPEKDELYFNVFSSIVMDFDSEFSDAQYSLLLNQITPALADYLVSNNPELATNLLKQFNFDPDVSEYIDSLRDLSSKIEYAIRTSMLEFRNDLQSKDVGYAIQKNNEFYSVMISTFDKLPNCYIFNLVDSKELLVG